MDRIDNVDLREAMADIAKCNTSFHLDNDLGISIDQMERAANLNDYTDKTLIWVSYPSGIDCYPEREVFQKGTCGYNGVLYHGFDMQSDLKLAYAVDVIGIKDGRLSGTLYEIDIREYAANVKENAVPANTIRIYDEAGRQTVMPKDEFDRRYPLDLVKMTYWRREPDDPSALKAVMDNVWNDSRDGKYKECSLWSHTSRLYDNRFDFYAGQLLRDLSKLEKPNSLDRQSFTVSLHSVIASAFNPEQLGRLLEKLPYKDAAFTVRKGQSFMELAVPREEIQVERWKQQGKPTVVKDGKEIPVSVPSNDNREKPSILDALKQGAEKSRQQSEHKQEYKKSKGMEI